MEQTARPNPRGDIIRGAVVLAAFVGFGVLVSLTSAFVVSLFLIAFLWDVETAIPLVIALAALILSAVMLMLNQGGTAEALANWTYYFFAIGVAKLFYEHLKLQWATREDVPDRGI